MKPTRVRTLVLVALVCAVLMWLALHPVYARLPPLPWTGVPALVLLAIGEAWSGRTVRARLRGRSSKPVHAIAVARMAALAKASSLAGALIGGLATGFLLFVVGSLDKPAYRSDALAAGLTLAGSLVLVLAALYLEYGCRVPTPRRDEGEGSQPPAPR